MYFFDLRLDYFRFENVFVSCRGKFVIGRVELLKFTVTEELS